MEFMTSATMEVTYSTAASLGRQIGYLFHYKKNVAHLANEVDDLSSMQKDIEWRASAARRSGEMIYQVVDSWLNRVERILYDSRKVIDVANGVSNCFKGWWCCGRYHLGKKADKLIGVVIELLDEGENLSELAIRAPTQNMGFMPTEDIEAFESTKAAMDLVMEALKNDKVSIIGVCGMGGIGKTTLMRKVCNQVKMNKLFDVVIMVNVSQNQDLKRIQDEIATDLCFGFGKENWESRARRLLMRLKQEMRVLIILDDIWTPMNLTEVGIPFGENHKGCKVVLTTRRQEVCLMMESQANIQLGCLSELESWKLFRMSAGIDVDSPILNEVARAVAKECEGLPLALVALGRALHGQDQIHWVDALQKLRESETDFANSNAQVFQSVKLSYNYLPCEEYKLIFLFCCLFPEDNKISIDDLLRYIMGEGILKAVNLNQAKRKLYTVVDRLISSSLLLKGDLDGFVLMHGVIRDVAIRIASKDHGFVVKTGRGLEAWPAEEVLQNCVRLSLMGTELSKLPERPECPRIRTLTLSRCRSLKNIPDSFFEGMKSLLSLDLSHTPISALPSSLPCLENLRSLSLDNCSALKDATLIGKLVTLEIISLMNTPITILPVREMGEISNLKLLALGRRGESRPRRTTKY